MDADDDITWMFAMVNNERRLRPYVLMGWSTATMLEGLSEFAKL